MGGGGGSYPFCSFSTLPPKRGKAAPTHAKWWLCFSDNEFSDQPERDPKKKSKKEETSTPASMGGKKRKKNLSKTIAEYRKQRAAKKLKEQEGGRTKRGLKTPVPTKN